MMQAQQKVAPAVDFRARRSQHHGHKGRRGRAGYAAGGAAMGGWGKATTARAYHSPQQQAPLIYPQHLELHPQPQQEVLFEAPAATAEHQDSAVLEPCAMQPVADRPQQLPPMSVFVRGLPKNLCNGVCMEAILEQAGLEDAIVSCEAWPGASSGEALIQLASWNAAELCARHFHGCRWCATGATVFAELATPPAPDLVNYDTMPEQTPAGYVTPEDSDIERSGNRMRASPIDIGMKAGLSPLASPALTAASTATPPSPAPSASSSPLVTSKKSDHSSVCRKVSWADLMSDDEDEDDSVGNSTTLENDPATDSGSAGVGTSDDGF